MTGESKWLERAAAAAERAISEFWLESAGGFAMTRAGHDPFLPARPVEFGDGVIPSANGVMLELLIRLQKRLRRADWDAKIQTLLDRYAAMAGTGAMSCCAAAWAQNILNSPALDVTVRAKTDGGMIDPFIRVFYRRFLPEANFVIERSETASQGIVCLNQSCSVPRTQIESWTAELVRLG